MRNFQYVTERFSNLLKEWIHQNVDEDLTDYDVRCYIDELIGEFQVDLFFEIRDRLHSGKININKTNELDIVIDSFYKNRVYPQLSASV